MSNGKYLILKINESTVEILDLFILVQKNKLSFKQIILISKYDWNVIYILEIINIKNHAKS